MSLSINKNNKLKKENEKENDIIRKLNQLQFSWRDINTFCKQRSTRPNGKYFIGLSNINSPEVMPS
jgi:hypothetical protein